MPYEIRADYENYLKAKVGGKRLQNNLRASTVGFECARHHYYSLTEYKEPPSWQLQAIFDEGLLHEKAVEKLLREMGYEIEGVQKEFRIEDPLITIHIDGMLRKGNGPWYPFDSKSINQFDFDKLTSAEDFIHSKKFYQKNYVTQLLSYMYATNSEYGYLIMKNKQSGLIRDVLFSFEQHVSFLDSAFKRAKAVYAAVAEKKPPDRTDDLDLCLSCDFKHVCLPDLKMSPGVKLIEGDEIDQKLERLEELKPAKKEYEDLDGEVKDAFKQAGQGEYATANWLVRVKEQIRKSYTVPESTFLTTKFVKMETK